MNCVWIVYESYGYICNVHFKYEVSTVFFKQHINTIMYYLRKKTKYSLTVTSYSTVDCWFMAWIDNIEKQWRQSECDMRCISPDHDVGQCIREFKLLANIPWVRVDEVIIPVSINDKFHWFLVVFRIKHRCLYIYDSMMRGSVHSRTQGFMAKG